MRLNVWYLIGAVWAASFGFAFLSAEGAPRWWAVAAAFTVSLAFLFVAGYTATRKVEPE